MEGSSSLFVKAVEKSHVFSAGSEKPPIGSCEGNSCLSSGLELTGSF